MNAYEKSAWICLFSTGAVYLPYFVKVFGDPTAGLLLFWIALAAMIFITVAFHVTHTVIEVLARRRVDGSRSRDEMEERIEWRAAKVSGTVLATVVLVWIVHAMYVLPMTHGESVREHASVVIALPVLFRSVHVLFAGFVLANLGYYGSIIFGYRRVSHD